MCQKDHLMSIISLSTVGSVRPHHPKAKPPGSWVLGLGPWSRCPVTVAALRDPTVVSMYSVPCPFFPFDFRILSHLPWARRGPMAPSYDELGHRQSCLPFQPAPALPSPPTLARWSTLPSAELYPGPQVACLAAKTRRLVGRSALFTSLPLYYIALLSVGCLPTCPMLEPSASVQSNIIQLCPSCHRHFNHAHIWSGLHSLPSNATKTTHTLSFTSKLSTQTTRSHLIPPHCYLPLHESNHGSTTVLRVLSSTSNAPIRRRNGKSFLFPQSSSE